MNDHQDKILSWDKGCVIIGEVAQAHDGSLGMAHAYIDAIARSGADGVKFQTHIAAAESTLQEPWRVKFSPQDAIRYDYWKRMEFSEEQWQGLKNHAAERGLLFLSSPFSIEAVELLKKVGVAGWKIASGELTHPLLLERLAETGLPILLSTGMSPLSEIETVVGRIKKADLPLAVLQCTSAYPAPPEKIGLNLIPFFRERFGCAVGLSDHSGTVFPGLAAVTMGIEVLEVHVTLSREMFGPDVPASLTTPELALLVEGVRFIEKVKANPVDKDTAALEMAPMRELFTKSLVAKMDLPAGTLMTEEHISFKKPGTGIPAAQFDKAIGKRLGRSLKADEMIQWNDLI